ncbi:DnaD domain-containing protein [Apilactobacillus xinyiensis]|uniref:DnaD domain-containing protein n=1 Tax=Apilactobacillus xinyiensis TaxID=2841032 RepID=UPI00200DA267|nr:DnaD domain protein [Apilactobacillus xinyiensis]MCL0330576.1 DnaD domain protein [Apilactobacillus xinyiensis]
MVKVYKDRQSNFTHIKNDIFNTEKHDEINTLTWKAIGIFTYMWHLPDDWEFYEDELASHVKDGKAGLRSGLKELEQAGFIKRKWKRNADGKFASYDWILCEAPFCDFPKTGKPKTDKPISDNRKLLSTEGTKYLNNKVLSSSSEPDFQKIFTLFEKNVGVVNPLIGQKIKDELQDWKTISPSDYLDIVHYALELAIENTKISNKWRYVEGILDNWEKRQLTTMDKIHNAEELHRKQKESKYKQPYQRKHIKEELPEWARDDYKRVPDEHVDEKKKAEIKAMMKEIDGN